MKCMHSEGKCSSVNFMQLPSGLPHASVFDQVSTPMMCNIWSFGYS